MNHNAGPLDLALPKSLPRPLDRARARKLPRQRRVQVYNGEAGGGEGRQERGRQDVHPAGADGQGGRVGED